MMRFRVLRFICNIGFRDLGFSEEIMGGEATSSTL
jgi:hypothetical protein